MLSGERQSPLTRPLVAAPGLSSAQTLRLLCWGRLVLSPGELVWRGQCEDVDVVRASTAPKGRVDGVTEGARQGHPELVTVGQAPVRRSPRVLSTCPAADGRHARLGLPRLMPLRTAGFCPPRSEQWAETDTTVPAEVTAVQDRDPGDCFALFPAPPPVRLPGDAGRTRRRNGSL